MPDLAVFATVAEKAPYQNKTSMMTNKLQQYLAFLVCRTLLDCRFVFILFSQIMLLLFTYYVSFLFRFDFRLTSQYQPIFVQTLPIVVVLKLPIFYVAGLFRGWWRYAGT